MRFSYNATFCHNLELSLRSEWLETNGTGDYASSTLTGCNTRKYHGLLISGDGYPEKRAVLLSCLEESLQNGDEHFFSTHAYPGVYYPHGYEYIDSVNIDHWPAFSYIFPNGVKLVKELMMIPGKALTMIRYHLTSGPLTHNGSAVLRLRPMTAFRHFHSLSHKNDRFNTELEYLPSGIKMDAYYETPFLYIEVEGGHRFFQEPVWYDNIEYPIERERGFAFTEDLFQPGVFEMSLQPDDEIYFSAATSSFAELFPGERMKDIWDKECRRRKRLKTKAVEEHLQEEGKRFIIEIPGFTGIDAGYPWFNVWGRDMFIALPWLTFYAGREKAGVSVIRSVASEVKNGLVPNMFDADGHAYNSIDASLWYIAAVQQMLLSSDKHLSVIEKEIRPVIKSIIAAYADGGIPFVSMDEEGFLSVGSENTQLTWMDASVNGQPATSRYGCPVEIMSLWYNALVFDKELAELLDDGRTVNIDLDQMRESFVRRFWLEEENYLADVWRDDFVDKSLRPNQLFAVGLPYAILDGKYHKQLVMKVKKHLLTPYGMRTLAPDSLGYHSHYRGSHEERDASYHQGTVWPWLLGIYTESLLKATKYNKTEIKSLLKTVTPLYSKHLTEAGVGSISEIFDAEEPFKADGTIAQAWSVSECYRLLMLIKNAVPEIYGDWESKIRMGA